MMMIGCFRAARTRGRRFARAMAMRGHMGCLECVAYGCACVCDVRD